MRSVKLKVPRVAQIAGLFIEDKLLNCMVVHKKSSTFDVCNLQSKKHGKHARFARIRQSEIADENYFHR
jgi:translation elongation factor P/translation initiation factor 5A